MCAVIRIVIAVLLAALASAFPVPARSFADAPDASVASYRVSVLDTQPLRLSVSATLPGGGDRLLVADSRPGDIPELDAGGWPAIFKALHAVATDGTPIALAPAGDAGWSLATTPDKPFTLRYEIDYSTLAGLGWPAPRESAYADGDAIVLAGRALFIATPTQSQSLIAIEPPAGWHVAGPWPRDAASGAFHAAARSDLFDNLVAMSRMPADTIDAGGFSIDIVATGDWKAVRRDVRILVAAMAQSYARLMPTDDGDAYLMVLLPQPERGGESFRNSFALNVDAPPGNVNRAGWGGILAHELFHYWNGWRLRGIDYASTQWFQEGFTEYMANKAMLAAGMASAEDFLAILQQQIADAGRLQTPLDAPGTHKGPPLYGGGALVAFCWDVSIREASGDGKTLADVFALLWDATGRGARPYDWPTIRTALHSVAPGVDWDGFHARHISGREPLPLAHVFGSLGLRQEHGDGAPRVAFDETASAVERARWRSFATR